MRRKTRNADATPTPEKATRRSTRGRGRRSPSPEENAEDDSASRDIDEESEPEVMPTPKRRGRKPTRTPSSDVQAPVTPKRGRGRKKAVEPVIEEQPEQEEVPETSAKSKVEEEKEEVEKEIFQVDSESEQGPQEKADETEEPAAPVVEEESQPAAVEEEEDPQEIVDSEPDAYEEPDSEPEPEPEAAEPSPVPQAEEEESKAASEQPSEPSDEPMEIHADDDDSHQLEALVEPAEPPKKLPADSEAEEGEVVDDSSDKKSESEEERPVPPPSIMRRMRRNTDRVSNEQKTTTDASVDPPQTDTNKEAVAEPADKENAPRPRKRKWLSQKSTETKPAVISISTDSLKNIIKEDVKLADVKLDLSPEPPKEKRRASTELETVEKKRKVSLAKEADDVKKSPEKVEKEKLPVPKPMTPPKHKPSNILYITNLVRPFTVLQLKGLLARTGKIVENGFWIDKIKSKCFVKYETEDEATETRHALHGVRWPASNPKCLHVDFGRDTDMEKAIMSTLEETVTRTITNEHATREPEVLNTFGWSKSDTFRGEQEDKTKDRPVREWDLGKQRPEDKERDRRRERDRDKTDREKDKGRDRDRDRKDHKRTSEGDVKRSRSLSEDRRLKKKDNEPPLRLLDDLFRKTKATPCIYWLPLTPEMIQEKEDMRKQRLEENQRRLEQQKKNREDELKRRQRDRERRHSVSRDRRRRSSHSRSRSRSRENNSRRRYR